MSTVQGPGHHAMLARASESAPGMVAPGAALPPAFLAVCTVTEVQVVAFALACSRVCACCCLDSWHVSSFGFSETPAWDTHCSMAHLAAVC